MIINICRIIIFFIIIFYLIITKKIKNLQTRLNIYSFILKLFNIKVNIINNSNVDLKNSQPFIIMSNHYHFIDSMVLKKLNICSLSVAKSNLLDTINIKLDDEKKYFDKIDLLSYDRKSKKSGLLVKKTILKKYFIRNKNIIIYPEGTSTKNGKPKDFKNGIMKLCSANYMKVLPITIKYNKDIGLNIGDKFNIDTLMDLECTLYIHPIQRETDWIKLKQKVFNCITSI